MLIRKLQSCLWVTLSIDLFRVARLPPFYEGKRQRIKEYKVTIFCKWPSINNFKNRNTRFFKFFLLWNAKTPLRSSLTENFFMYAWRCQAKRKVDVPYRTTTFVCLYPNYTWKTVFVCWQPSLPLRLSAYPFFLIRCQRTISNYSLTVKGILRSCCTGPFTDDRNLIWTWCQLKIRKKGGKAG